MAYIDYNRSPYCSQNACQRARVQAEILEHKTKVNQVIQQSVELFRHSQQPTENDENHPSTPINAILPYNDKALVELPEDRKEAFIAHLRRVYQSVCEQKPNAEATYVAELKPADDELTSTMLGKACGTCKGACCGLGETHAFQDYWSLRRYVSAFEKMPTEKTVINDYRKYLPSHSYHAACVFQGEMGCALPSDMRATTCRNYKCDGLINYENTLRDAGTNLTHAAGTRGRTVLHISVFDETTTQIIPIAKPALS